MNLHIQVLPAADTADFRLLISATDDTGANVATVGSLDIDDPQLSEKLRLVAQAFRMGTRFGKE